MANSSPHDTTPQQPTSYHHHHQGYAAPAAIPNSFNDNNNNNQGAAGASDLAAASASCSSTDWTQDEQSILEDGLSKFASESNIIRYAKIAVQLHNKTVRDVALRCRWMTKKENSKRRKEENSLTRKNKDRKEKMTDSMTSSLHLVTQNSYPSQAQGNVSNTILYSVIGSATGQLLQQNAQTFEQISANLENFQLHENFSLFCQARDNIYKILNNLGEVPEKMKQMPPLPQLDERLANTILPNSMQ